MKFLSFGLLCVFLLISCSEEKTPTPAFFSQFEQRNFSMGFGTWSYGRTLKATDSTYDFISQNGDIHCEHFDWSIPWASWFLNQELPFTYVAEIEDKKSRLIPGKDLLLSVGVLNFNRDDLAIDRYSPPPVDSFNDPLIVDAYTKHLNYLITEFEPTYLVMSIEANELLIHSPEKWEGYKSLMQNVRTEISSRFPQLKITESFSLHNLYQPSVPNTDEYIDEIVSYANQLDFVAISFYPYLKGLTSKHDFQNAFDFLHSRITKPIVFTETAHIAEDLINENLNLNIPGNPAQQNIYLQTLLENAQEHNYEFIIWWMHRDFDKLWNTYPDDYEFKDLLQVWRDTGLLDEDGNERAAYDSWKRAFAVPE